MVNPQDKSLKINVRLFRRIQRMITKFPQAFDMSSWDGEYSRGRYTTQPMKFDPKTMKEPNCGSACCLAGWAVILGDKISLERVARKPASWDSVFGDYIPERAQELLGLTEIQAERLFNFKGKHSRLRLVKPEEVSAAIDRFLADPSKPIR